MNFSNRLEVSTRQMKITSPPPPDREQKEEGGGGGGNLRGFSSPFVVPLPFPDIDIALLFDLCTSLFWLHRYQGKMASSEFCSFSCSAAPLA